MNSISETAAVQSAEGEARREVKLKLPAGHDKEEPVLIQGGKPCYAGETVKLTKRQIEELSKKGIC